MSRGRRRSRSATARSCCRRSHRDGGAPKSAGSILKTWTSAGLASSLLGSARARPIKGGAGQFVAVLPDNFVSRGPGIVDGTICARPQAADIALVIEVSSSTRRKDEPRAKLYTRLAIPEYWLIDLEGASVVVHRSPEHPNPKAFHYASVFALGRNALRAAGCRHSRRCRLGLAAIATRARARDRGSRCGRYPRCLETRSARTEPAPSARLGRSAA